MAEVEEIPEGYGTGDYFDGTSWTKGPPDPEADLEQLVVDQEYRLIMLELGVM